MTSQEKSAQKELLKEKSNCRTVDEKVKAKF